MKNKNGIAVWLGIILFAALILAAIKLQSAYCLYAASAIPVLLVPFLPDLPSAQRLKPGSKSSGIRMYRTSSLPDDGFLIIETEPGAIAWSRRKLLFSVAGVPVVSAAIHGGMSAGLTVLPYDLFHARKKKNLYGIHLPQLNDRLRTLSYTTDEVTRLVIRMEDLAALDPAYGAVRNAQVGKGLEA